MLLALGTGGKLQVTTSAAGTIHTHASYLDVDGAGAITTGTENNIISTAATVDVVDPPGSGKSRNVKSLYVGNAHATTSNTITITHTDGTTAIEIEKVTLLPGERLAIREGVPTRVVDAAGLEKVNPNIQSGSLIVARLAADLSNSTTTAAKVTGLDIAVPAGTWVFEYFIVYQAAATTTGVKFSVNHSGTVTSFVANVSWLTAADAAGTALNAADQDVLTANAGLMGNFGARAKSTAGWGTTLSVDTANADMFAQVQGIMTVTVAGNIELYHGSEVAAASTVKAGTSVRLTKTG